MKRNKGGIENLFGALFRRGEETGEKGGPFRKRNGMMRCFFLARGVLSVDMQVGFIKLACFFWEEDVGWAWWI